MTSQRTRDRLVNRLRNSGINHAGVLSAIAKTPRHLFVDEALASRAYEDAALPIGHQQTISQPYIVALMSQALLEGCGKQNRILEIGTGCGYQTMVLSQLVNLVYTVERIAALHQQAKARLSGLNVRNAYFKHGDGFLGWKDQAPFSGILITAAPETVPDSLYQQLAVGGVMILPEGEKRLQKLITITRTASGFHRHEGDAVNFVPMLSGVI